MPPAQEVNVVNDSIKVTFDTPISVGVQNQPIEMELSKAAQPSLVDIIDRKWQYEILEFEYPENHDPKLTDYLRDVVLNPQGNQGWEVVGVLGPRTIVPRGSVGPGTVALGLLCKKPL